SYAQVLVDTDSRVPMVGASGAVSGLLAAYIVLFPHGKIRTLIVFGIFITATMLPAWMMIGYWFLIQLISGIGALNTTVDASGGVSLGAHFGGMLTGRVLVWIFRDKRRHAAQNAARRGSVPQLRWGYGVRYPIAEDDSWAGR